MPPELLALPVNRAVKLPPLVEPAASLDPEESRRYARHLVLPGIGGTGQRRLKAARVLVVRARGPGSPAPPIQSLGPGGRQPAPITRV